MLRISQIVGPGEAATLKLEGKLLGPWVGALRDTALLGISVPAVKTRLHCARQALRSLLAPMFTSQT